MLPLNPPGEKPRPYLQGSANETAPNLAPSSDWLAYASDETRRFEVYVQSFPNPGRKYQVSVTGGAAPVWSRDGKELYYIGMGKELMAVSIKTQGGKLVVSPPRMLFRTRMHASRYAIFQYDVSPDGKRFLINSLPREDAAAPLTLLTNWQAQIGK